MARFTLMFSRTVVEHAFVDCSFETTEEADAFANALQLAGTVKEHARYMDMDQYADFELDEVEEVT